MLIDFNTIHSVLRSNSIHIQGALHIGAHECEELPFYNQLGLDNTDIIWIDAIPSKVDEAKQRGIPNVYNALITDEDDADILFNISNNGQSSSVLEFGTHAYEHSWVVYVDKIQEKSITVDTFFHRNNIDPSKYNFWNFDIQGAELMALKGAINSIQHADALYLEVNVNELYKNCALIGEIDIFLAQYNFQRVLTNITCHGWGDALYIRNEITQTPSEAQCALPPTPEPTTSLHTESSSSQSPSVPHTLHSGRYSLSGSLRQVSRTSYTRPS